MPRPAQNLYVRTGRSLVRMISTTLRNIFRRLRSPWAAGSLTPEARQTREDRALARHLRTTFEKDLQEADVHGLRFYVRSGTVTLYGAVRHQLDGDLLVDLTQQSPGVEDVVAHLQITDEPTGS